MYTFIQSNNAGNSSNTSTSGNELDYATNVSLLACERKVCFPKNIIVTSRAERVESRLCDVN